MTYLKSRFLFVVCMFLLLGSFFLYGNERKVALDLIRVNGVNIEDFQYDFLVISPQDSISFFYHLETKDTTIRPAFLFRITIKNSTDSFSYTLNVRNVNFKNLPEDNYTFRIEAFDPRNKLRAEPFVFNFRVDSKTSQLCKELIDLRKKVAASGIPSTPAPKTEFVVSNLNYISISIGFVAGFLFFIILFLLTKRGKAKRKQISEIEPGTYGNVIALDKAAYEQLLTENSNLRAEISALRGQIEAINARAEELRKQNQELKEKVEKLSRSKDELEELQKQKDELFAVIIHDIKNPAALIKNLVELLRSYDLTATEQQEIIEDILLTSTRIVNLSQEVSRILALESSVLQLNLEPHSLNEIVQEVATSNSVAAKNKNIKLEVDLNEEIPIFKLDRLKVYEVIDNLVSNAIKFTQKGGEVRIKTEMEDNRAIVKVIDNGLGLSEEDINRAFQRGARLSARPTADEPSSGLGLWIVKRLVEAMKGRVWVRSVLGKGSTFAFSIPIVLDDILKPEEIEEESTTLQ